MPEVERVTITLPAELAQFIRAVVDEGDYASTSELVRESLRDWKLKRAVQQEELAALRADVAKGIADVEAGRTKAFDSAAIRERGRKLLAQRSPSA